VPINSTREAGTGTGIEIKTPNGIKIKEIQKIGREENYLMKLKGKVPRECKREQQAVMNLKQRKDKII